MIQLASLAARKPTKTELVTLVQPILSPESVKFCDHAELTHSMQDEEWASLRLFAWTDMVKPVIKKAKRPVPQMSSTPTPSTTFVAPQPDHSLNFSADVPMYNDDGSDDEAVMDYKQANDLMMKGLAAPPSKEREREKRGQIKRRRQQLLDLKASLN